MCRVAFNLVYISTIKVWSSGFFLIWQIGTWTYPSILVFFLRIFILWLPISWSAFAQAYSLTQQVHNLEFSNQLRGTTTLVSRIPSLCFCLQSGPLFNKFNPPRPHQFRLLYLHLSHMVVLCLCAHLYTVVQKMPSSRKPRQL